MHPARCDRPAYKGDAIGVIGRNGSGKSTFDAYFRKGFGSAFSRQSLQKVASFYEKEAEVIDSFRTPTLDFTTGAESEVRYTRAKVIDMIFFVEGYPRKR